METKEIQDLLNDIKSQVSLKNEEIKKDFEAKFATFEGLAKSNDVDALKSAIDDMQKHLDALDVKSKEKAIETKNVSFDSELSQEIKSNFELIKGIKKGNSASLELKAVGNMTAALNVTPAGAVINTYQSGIALNPAMPLNFAQLVPTVRSATGSYVIYREIAGEGSISTQSTHGAAKTQIDFDAQAVTYNAEYLAGYARYAKQMAQDLPFLTSWLPAALRREYFIAENAKFHTALSTTATAVPAGTLGNEIERIIKVAALLETKNFMATGVVINPADWAKIAITEKSTGAGYGLPGIVTINNGQLAVNGINVYKANWIPAGKYAVGDWSMAKKVVVDGLAVEFFEQDQDNVIKNLITARIEERNVLAFDRPDAFYYGDFSAV